MDAPPPGPGATRPGLALALPGRRKPYVMAHRGNRTACPENTLASFRRALEDGADVLETDLWLSADGVFVCIHDATLERTTDGTGRVEDRSLAELKALSAGCGRPEYASERIPALAELCALLPPDRGLALELKSDRFLDPDVGRRLGEEPRDARRPRAVRRPFVLAGAPRGLPSRRAAPPDRLDHAEGVAAAPGDRAPRAVLAAPPPEPALRRPRPRPRAGGRAARPVPGPPALALEAPPLRRRP